MSFRAGFVAVAGRPNVGKSTLVNRILGQKIAAVSPRPQTTQRNQLGIYTDEQVQVIFVDTPGLHKPVHRLGEFMNQEALDALLDADLVLWLLDASQPLSEEDRAIAERLKEQRRLPAVWLVLNKADLAKGTALETLAREAAELFPPEKQFTIAAARGKGVDELLAAVKERLPEGEAFYDSEQITDRYERDIAADLVREAALEHLEDEIPHTIAVKVEEYIERGESGAHILAAIYVEREAHKGIVIGKQGEMLKKIGTSARQAIEEMSGRKVFLELRVKVQKNWRNTPEGLRAFGFLRDKGTK